jgi:hypothetical protein
VGKKRKREVARSQRLPAQALVDETRVLQRVVAVVFLEKHHDPAFPSFTQEQQWALRKMCEFSKSRIKNKTKKQDNNAWMPGLESAEIRGCGCVIMSLDAYHQVPPRLERCFSTSSQIIVS